MPGKNKQPDSADEDDASGSEQQDCSDDEESNWQGGAQAEEQAVQIHLDELNTDKSPKKQVSTTQNKTAPK